MIGSAMNVEKILLSIQKDEYFNNNREKMIVNLIPHTDRFILAYNMTNDPVTRDLISLCLDVIAEYLDDVKKSKLPAYVNRALN